MGWSWSLFFCQDVTEDSTIQGTRAAAQVSALPDPALLDGRPLPSPSLAHAFLLV